MAGTHNLDRMWNIWNMECMFVHTHAHIYTLISNNMIYIISILRISGGV